MAWDIRAALRKFRVTKMQFTPSKSSAAEEAEVSNRPNITSRHISEILVLLYVFDGTNDLNSLLHVGHSSPIHASLRHVRRWEQSVSFGKIDGPYILFLTALDGPCILDPASSFLIQLPTAGFPTSPVKSVKLQLV